MFGSKPCFALVRVLLRPVRSSTACLSSGEWLQGGSVEDVDGGSHVSLCPPGNQMFQPPT